MSAIPISLSPRHRGCRSPYEHTLTRRRPSPVRGHAPALSRRGHRPSWLQRLHTARACPRLLPHAPARFGRRPLRTTPLELCPRPRFPGARRHPRLPSLATATTEAPATRASRSLVRSPLRPPPAASSPRYPSSLRPAATSAASLGRRLGRRCPAASGHGLCLRSGAHSARSGHPAPVARYAPGPMTYGPAPERFYKKRIKNTYIK